MAKTNFKDQGGRRKKMTTLLGKDLTYGLLNNALDASHLRQQTISNNIANVNTKNYKANRVIFEEELKKAMSGAQVSLRATRKNHYGVQSNTKEISPRVIKEQSTTMRTDGNNVDIDLEMSNLAANQILYNTLVQQASNKITSLRYVIHEGRR